MHYNPLFSSPILVFTAREVQVWGAKRQQLMHTDACTDTSKLQSFNPRQAPDYNARYSLVFDLSVRTDDKEYRFQLTPRGKSTHKHT